MLLDQDRHANVDGRRTEAHLVIARLVSKLTRHYCCSSLCPRWHFEVNVDVEGAGKYRQLLAANLDLFRLRITRGPSLKRAVTPRELQRDNEFVFRFVTVHVKAGLHDNFECLNKSRTPFGGDGLGWPDCKFILLG